MIFTQNNEQEEGKADRRHFIPLGSRHSTLQSIFFFSSKLMKKKKFWLSRWGIFLESFVGCDEQLGRDFADFERL